MAREPVWKAVWRVDRKIPVILGVLLITNIGIYLVLTGMFEKKAEQLERRYIIQQSEVRQAEQGGQTTESPLIVYARGTKDLQTFRSQIPSNDKLTGLVDEIFTVARSAGLEIARISYHPKDLTEIRLLQYGLDFNVTGTYNQIKKFTHLIEQSGRLIIIDQMTLNTVKESARVNLKLKLTTYFRADES